MYFLLVWACSINTNFKDIVTTNNTVSEIKINFTQKLLDYFGIDKQPILKSIESVKLLSINMMYKRLIASISKQAWHTESIVRFL